MSQPSLANELLQWLFRVLQPEYVDPRTAYHDIAVALQTFPTLKPRTRVFTTESGESLLLLNLYGSLPATINNKTYKIPVELWIPHEYPLAAPLAYVVPTEKMVLRPGNHVDANGKCYMHLLATWGPQSASIVALCQNLSSIFSQEPPVYAKPAVIHNSNINTPIQSPHSQMNTPPRLPPKTNTTTAQTASPIPALPPKQLQSSAPTSPPPLPPLPDQLRAQMIKSPTLKEMNQQSQFVRPIVTEEPNIIDEINDNGTSTDTERESTLNLINDNLQRIYNEDVSQTLQKFNTDVNSIKYAIGKFDKIFEYEFNTIDKTNSQIQQNEIILKNTITGAEETIQKAQNFKEINTDEIICAETVVYNQLYDLVAEDQAISDTIYALTKAHDNGNIPLNNFIKHTRNLAREQFMKKALIVKISEMLNLSQELN